VRSLEEQVKAKDKLYECALKDIEKLKIEAKSSETAYNFDGENLRLMRELWDSLQPADQ
jgi:hypothetical protein